MSNNLKIGVGQFSNRIFIGGTLKNGLWSENRTDVTNDAIKSVIEHAMKFKEKTGDNIKITNEDGSVFCEIVIKTPSDDFNKG